MVFDMTSGEYAEVFETVRKLFLDGIEVRVSGWELVDMDPFFKTFTVNDGGINFHTISHGSTCHLSVSDFKKRFSLMNSVPVFAS